MKNKNVLVIDCDGICWNVFHAMPPLSHNEKGTAMLYGFLNRIFEIQEFTRASHIAFVWDSRNSKRIELFPEYKFKRRNKKKEYTEEEVEIHKDRLRQVNLLREEILPTLGFRNVLLEDGLEGDDIIASISQKYSRKHRVKIVARDADLYQLLNDRCVIYDIKDRKIVDEEVFFDKYGIYPDMWADVKGIAGCFAEGTEVLTDSGWKDFKHVTTKDLVYSMDPLTRKATYESIENVISYQYTGDLYNIKGKLIDITVTPDHTFFGSSTQSYPSAKSKGRNTVSFRKIKDLLALKNFTIPINCVWNDTQQLPVLPFTLPAYTSDRKCTYHATGSVCTNSIHHEETNIPMKDWVRFLGIWLADGWASDRVGIAAKKQRKRDQFTSILKTLPWDFSSSDGGWYLSHMPLTNYLKRFGKAHEKYIPKDIKQLPADYLELLINAMLSGDGYIQKEHVCTGTGFMEGKKCICSGKKEYYTCSPQLADDFQEICIKAGYSTSMSTSGEGTWDIKGKTGTARKSYTVRILKSNNCNILQKQIVKVPYDGKVWCVETKKHSTILVRKNGHVLWSGNCSTDEVPGIKGIGEGWAIKYLLGKMKLDSKLHQRIVGNPDTIAFTRKLVVLPFEGTPKYKLRRDRCKPKALKDVALKYGLKSYLSPERMHQFKECFCNGKKNIK